MAFWHRNGARVHSVDNPASVGTVVKQDDEQVFVRWDPPYGPTWEMIRDLEPIVNHPENPNARQLIDLWFDAFTLGTEEARHRYFDNLAAARLTSQLGHLAILALLMTARAAQWRLARRNPAR